MITDTHLHLPIIKKDSFFEKAKKKLLSDMRKNGIDYGVLIPDNAVGSKIGDLDTCLNITEKEKKLFLLGTIDIQKQGKEWINKLSLLFRGDRIKGIKIFPGHDPIYPTDKRLIPVLKLCLKYDYPIVIHTGWNSNNPEAARYNNPKHIVKIAKKFPKLKIVIAHYFWPEVEYCYQVTEGLKNIFFDTSGLADKEVIKETGLKKIKSILRMTIKNKPESVVFGSDYPMGKFKSHIALINALKINQKEKRNVFWKNAVRLFRLNLRK